MMTREEKEYVAQRKCELIDTRQKLVSVAAWFDNHLKLHETDQYVRGMDIAWCIRRVVDKVDSAIDIMKIVLDEEEEK